MIVFLAVLAIWIFSLCLHEYAHARVAYAGGDTSVEAKGYLDFNPFRYMDPVNSLVLPIVFLLLGGLALPGGAVYIDPTRLRTKGWETAVSLAGPAANLLMCVACAAPFFLGFEDPMSTHPAWGILAVASFLQIVATLLNLLPVPGLDGYRALEPWLPWSVRDALAPYKRYGFFLLLILFLATSFDAWLYGAVGGKVLAALQVPGDRLREGYAGFFFWKS
jgi:Zn-dependent protease